MPYFKIKLTADNDWLPKARALSERSQRNLRRALQTQLKPELQEQVDNLTPLDPGPSVHPFHFGTELSKRFWFWMITENPDLTDGESWIRHPDDPESVENAFHVEVSDRLRGNLIKIFNNNPSAKYVYGPWLVAGHSVTGWPVEARAMAALLNEYKEKRLPELWRQAVSDGLKGVG